MHFSFFHRLHISLLCLSKKCNTFFYIHLIHSRLFSFVLVSVHFTYLSQNSKGNRRKEESKQKLVDFQGDQVKYWAFVLPFMLRFNGCVHSFVYVCVCVFGRFEQRDHYTIFIWKKKYTKKQKFVTNVHKYSHTWVGNDNENNARIWKENIMSTIIPSRYVSLFLAPFPSFYSRL